MRASLLFLVLPALVASSRPADACSAPQCWPGAFVPGDGATIPLNAPGLYWRPSNTAGQPATPSTVRLVRYGDTTPIAVTPVAQPNSSDWVLVPQQPLVEGEQYVLEETGSCNDGPGAHIVFTAGPSAPLPTTLGAMNTIGHSLLNEIDVATGSGSCSTKVVAAVLQIQLEASPDASPWKDLLLYDTVVDGTPWRAQPSINSSVSPGGSWRGRGSDLLYRVCETTTDATVSPGLAVGGHQVGFRAVLPGTSDVLATSTTNIELMCEDVVDEIDEDDDGGCQAGSSSGSLGLLALAFLGMTLSRRCRSTTARSTSPRKTSK